MTQFYLNFRHAKKFNEQGNFAADIGNIFEAQRLYRKAAKIAPDWAAPYFNLGLLSKQQGLWEESLAYNTQALERDASHEGARWNQGIAATALGKWEIARAAWKAYGIDIPIGDGPIEMALGAVVIRLDGDEGAETVWATRIDPARAVLDSIPLPESGHCHGDVVLHDGEPLGYRILGERKVTVFNALALLKPSELSTYKAVVFAETQSDLDALEESLTSQDIVSENWATETQILCKACSEGTPHSHPAPERVPLEFGPGEYSFGIAAKEQSLFEYLISDWASKPCRKLVSLELVVDANKLESKNAQS